MSQKRKHKIKLEIGKFYRILDGSKTGHPGRIFKIDYENKVYHAIITGSMTLEEFKRLGLRKGYIKLSCPTDENIDISLIKKRPFAGDRNDYGEKEYPDMSFKEADIEIVIEVQKRRPILGKYYRKRQKIKPRG